MLLETICENDIITKIRNSQRVNESQKQEFINLICYFTPWEIEELKLLM